MIYVANYATLGSFEAEQDDPSMQGVGPHDGLDMMASPQLARVALRMSGDWVQQLKADVENEVCEEFECPREQLNLVWKTDGWKEETDEPRRSHQEYDLYDGEDLVAKLVIQRVQVDE